MPHLDQTATTLAGRNKLVYSFGNEFSVGKPQNCRVNTGACADVAEGNGEYRS
jgi:hypothetical protein